MSIARRNELPARTGTREQAARERLAPIHDEYPFRSRFYFHAPLGLSQHYVDEGPRGADPLLFLHGNPTWSFAWRNAIKAFSGAYRCVAPDHMGCGLSDKPRRYSYLLANHAENLERLVLDLDLFGITLVLHDWGGAIGMDFARRHPERIARLIVLNTAAFRSERIPLRIAACRVPVFGRALVCGLNAFARGATFMAVERALPAQVKRGYLLPYDSWDSRVATFRFVADIPMKAGHPSWDELGAIDDAVRDFADRPAAILWGERDWCFTPAFREEWQRRLPSAEVTRFEDAGHYVFEDAGPRLIASMADFLARHPRR